MRANGIAYTPQAEERDEVQYIIKTHYQLPGCQLFTLTRTLVIYFMQYFTFMLY